MESKKNKGVIISLIIVIVILMALLGLSFAGVLKLEKNVFSKTNDTEVPKEEAMVEVKEEKKSENLFDVIDVNEIDYNDKDLSEASVEQFSINRYGDELDVVDYSYIVTMNLSGNVKVDTTDEKGNSYNGYLSNVNNVVDMIHFSVAGKSDDQIIYMLVANGDVYYYKVGDSINKKYEATKVSFVSRVKRLFIYVPVLNKPAGGSWTLLALDENNEVTELNSGSV